MGESHGQKSLAGYSPWGCKRIGRNLVVTQQQYSLYTHFVDNFYHEWMLNFVKSFFCIYWNDIIIILQLADVVYHIDLQILKHPCIPGINPTWSWCRILLIYCWIQLANILLGIFAFMFIRDAAAAAAKSLQSCLTLCDPIDGSPPGSPIPGILQARTLE